MLDPHAGIGVAATAYRGTVPTHPHPAVRALERGMPLARFAAALGPVGSGRPPDPLDLRLPRDRERLLAWLRSWGCRHLRVADRTSTSRSLRTWATTHVARLPDGGVLELTAEQMRAAGDAYETLARRRAAFADRSSGRVAVTFGPTAASKTLYALRPEALPPWDAPMRAALAFGEDADGYVRYLGLTARSIRALSRRADIDPSALPAALDRPDVSAARLIDEYLWRVLTRGDRS